MKPLSLRVLRLFGEMGKDRLDLHVLSLWLWIGTSVFFVWLPEVFAQDNYEIQVYGSEMGAPGSTMFELHNNFTVQGSKTVKDGVAPTNHSMHETLEISHSFTDWFEAGFLRFQQHSAR